MANCSCFCAIIRRNKKYKGKERFRKTAKVHPPVEGPIESTTKTDELKSTSFFVPLPVEISGSSTNNVEEMSQESYFREAKEVEYEGEGEHDESLSIHKDSLDFHIQNITEEYGQSIHKRMNLCYPFNDYLNDQDQEKSDEEVMEIKKNGNISDPGIGKQESLTCRVLERSCSGFTIRGTLKKIIFEPPPPKSQSFDETKRLSTKLFPRSPISVSSHYSADKVKLKKHSSSKILPSRSRKLWWKLFLWSHRNVKGTSNTQRQTIPVKIIVRKQGGYSPDTLEPGQGMELSKLGSPGSFTGKSLKTGINNNQNYVLHDNHVITSLWSQNQWVACPAESSTFSRVDEWVKELSIHPQRLIEDDTNFPPSLQVDISLARSSSLINRRPNSNVPEDVIHANNVIQSLNSASTVAHLASIGLKVNPVMSHFSGLRSINISGNSIAQITQGSLPKSLHVLNLSRNQIHTIEGLKELTHLRVLDLSYNRISRIGRGLSNCTLIKELYLSANKISYVEGLHRLLKLSVLDLSFNKITTTNALQQLVANYSSIIALNLLGNPIQRISDDKLRKTVCSLLHKLVFLNKQHINQQKAREQALAEAALGNRSWATRRRTTKKVNHGNFASSSCRHRLRSRTQSQSSNGILSSLASSTH
ncbi:uncharacterized protein LOC132042851 [Lycium ferocissimum]|uniref:uncharacterized protein LOC132042851 n=1 Tax=Lycium ferocissimum TaxID=112874 RepID=UPI00281523BE|nr:uncharacterized protein LOC132042851 [Lycium ferocissimum]